MLGLCVCVFLASVPLSVTECWSLAVCHSVCPCAEVLGPLSCACVCVYVHACTRPCVSRHHTFEDMHLRTGVFLGWVVCGQLYCHLWVVECL